jgi:hypothetical protein
LFYSLCAFADSSTNHSISGADSHTSVGVHKTLFTLRFI